MITKDAHTSLPLKDTYDITAATTLTFSLSSTVIMRYTSRHGTAPPSFLLNT